jgi:DNA processing protein
MTGLLGLDADAVATAARAVRPDDRDLDEAFARGAWTGIAEPGDGVAGALLQAYGAVDALDALANGGPPTGDPALTAGFERWHPRVDAATLLRAFHNAAHLGIRLLLPHDAGWPPGLDDLGVHAPLALWALGQEAVLPALRRSIALVGARAATGYGEQVAAEAAAGLVDRGFAIVSGAAYGIDGTAHRSALASGGVTVAVLAGGLDRFYPSGHAALLQRIAREGVVLAELPCGFAPTKWRFLQRNRLIAAISGATVVLEAGARSGSLNTAGHAAALGRPLGAVPGSVFSAASAGCHRLLREYDAVCVRDAADMAELVTGVDGEQPTLPGMEPALDPLERRVLDALSRTPRSPLEIARRAGVSLGDAVAALGMLSLTGGAAERTGGWCGADERRGR